MIIQKEISITQKEVDECIEHYMKARDTFRLGMLGKFLDKHGIIREIKKSSELGKQILLMHHKFKELETQIKKR